MAGREHIKRQIFNMENILVMNLYKKRIDKNKLECPGLRLGLSVVLEMGRFERGRFLASSLQLVGY